MWALPPGGRGWIGIEAGPRHSHAHEPTSSSSPPPTRQVEEQEAGAGDDEAYILFSVLSRPNAPGSQGKPADAQRERSHFVREGGAWLYMDYK